MQLFIAGCKGAIIDGVKSKTAHLLPNWCFVAMLGARKSQGGRDPVMGELTMFCLAKTKQRYIFLLTHLGDSSYLLLQPVYLRVCALHCKRTLVKF
jgi:hypothetical protein